MGKFRIYDRAGVGFSISNSDILANNGSAIGSANDESPVSLGGGRFSQVTTMTGNPYFDRVTAFGVEAQGDFRVTGATATERGQVVIKFSGISIDPDVFDRPGGLAVFYGNDQIIGNRYADRILGYTGNDSLYGNGGNDKLYGSSGRDVLAGGAGRDVLSGGVGADRLAGGTGSDALSGGAGNDSLSGGSGIDRIDGGKGNDRLSGGTYSDTFVFRAGDGRDTITDFRNGFDYIEITSGADNFSQLRITDPGDDVLIAFGDVQIRLENVYSSYIGPEDFIFT